MLYVLPGLALAALLSWMFAVRRRPESVRQPTDIIASVTGAAGPWLDVSADPHDRRPLRFGAAAAAMLMVLAVLVAWGSVSVGSETTYRLSELALATEPANESVSDAPALEVSVEPAVGYAGCGKADVVVTARPSAAYFEQSEWAEDPGRDVRFAFAVAASLDVRPPERTVVSLGDGLRVLSRDVTGRETDAEYEPERLVQDLRVDAEPTTAESSRFAEHVVTGVIRNWFEHRAPLRVTFEADWARRLKAGSCTLSLPELVATALAGSAATSALGTSGSTLEASLASRGSVTVADGTRLDVDPRFAVDASFAGDSYSCRAAGTGPQEIVADPGCAALVVSERPSAESLRALASFLAAAIFSLGLQVGWEAHLRRR